MKKIVFLDRNAVRVSLRKPAFAHGSHTTPDEVGERLQGATIAITNRVRISAYVGPYRGRGN